MTNAFFVAVPRVDPNRQVVLVSDSRKVRHPVELPAFEGNVQQEKLVSVENEVTDTNVDLADKKLDEKGEREELGSKLEKSDYMNSVS